MVKAASYHKGNILSKYIPSYNEGEQLQRKGFIIRTTSIQTCEGDVL